MLNKNEIQSKTNIVNTEAEKISSEMSKYDYIITKEMLDTPLKKIQKLIRMMGFNKDQTSNIMESIRKDLIGKEMHEGDNFQELIKITFTKAIMNTIETMK